MSSSTRANQIEPQWLDIVEGQVASLRFGVVQIVVHDARVIQIERTEKLRLDKPGKGRSLSSCDAGGAAGPGAFDQTQHAGG